MDDGHGGRDIPPDEERLNYVYHSNSNGQNDIEQDAGLWNHRSESESSISQSINRRNGYHIQEPVDTTPDATGRIYHHVFPPQSQRQRLPSTPEYYMSEENRLTTFSDWSYQGVVRKEDLAKNGFIYTGSGDKVRCVFCNGILRQWDQGDVVEQEHRRNFPQCPFISGQNVGNIPLLPGSSAPSQTRFLSMSNNGSFPPANRGLDIDPFQEGYGASCMQAQSQNGDDHVKDASSVKNNTSGPDVSPTRGYSSCPRNPHMSVEPERLATFSSWPAQMKQKPDELAQAGLFYTGDGDRVKCFHCDGVLYDWEPEDDPFVEHARWFPHCQYIRLVKGENFVDDVQNGRPTEEEVMQTPAVLAVLYEGHSVESVKRALAVMRRKNGPGLVVTAQTLLTTLLELEDSAPKSCNGDVSSEDLHKLQMENESLRDKQLCKICMERDVEVIFLPCKHFVCCAPCSAALQVCPICRVAIQAIDKIFMV